MTLTEKSALLEQAAREHIRHGYVLPKCCAVADDPNSSWWWAVTDNDGSHTADYCAAESFRYAVTKSEDARRNARETLEALIRLVRLPEKRGFLARAAFRKDDSRIVAVAGEWHQASDGEWLWKGDTSSDELDTHMFAYGIYYDLVADQEEKRLLASTVSDLMGGIVENGFVLLDLDGKHTRWGVWSPQLLGSEAWEPERKLNSLEILAHLRSALHITGEQRFETAYRELVDKHAYAETIRAAQMAVPPEADHKFDDDLAFHAYYPLLKYETDPTLRSIYLDSLQRWWQVVRSDRWPQSIILANVFLERGVDLEVIFEVLSGYRLDRHCRAVVNAVRQDLEWRTAGGRKILRTPLPAAERAQYDLDCNVYLSERTGSPNQVSEPTPFLLPYWMARYHQLLSPP